MSSRGYRISGLILNTTGLIYKMKSLSVSYLYSRTFSGLTTNQSKDLHFRFFFSVAAGEF
jgi:hypothetical protein